MKNQFLWKGRFTLLCSAIALQGFSQTRMTDIAPGALHSTPTGLQVYGGNIYFLAKYSSNGSTMDRQEWFKLNATNGAVTQLTTDHQIATSALFRTPARIGNNVFVSCSKGTTTNLEFSRFNLAAETEQWIDLYTGNNGATDYYSDPIVYGEDPVTNVVYFNPSTLNNGNQLHYWNPSTNSITKLTSINGSTGISQNSSAGIVILGNYIYTAATIGGNTSFIKIDKATGTYTLFDAVTLGMYNPYTIRAVNNKIYFAARTSTGAGPYNLYCYDPAAGGNPAKLTNYTQTLADGNISGMFTGSDGNLYVNVTYYNTSPLQGQVMRVNVATNAITYYDGSSGTAGILNTYAFTTNDYLYVTELLSGKRDIVKYSLSTGARTVIANGQFTAASGFFKAANSRVYFSANDVTNGVEPWELSPNKDVLRMVGNINPGTGNSSPGNFTELSGKLYFSANDGTNGVELFSYTMPVGALPVKLLSFTAASANKTVQLQWQVAAQAGIKAYEVQRSEDGQAYKTIGTVNATATGEASYTFIDPAPASRNQYRLRLVESDGSDSYSAVRTMMLLQVGTLTISPNPVTGALATIRFSTAVAKVPYAVYNMAGTVVQKGTLQNGLNTVNIAALKAGKYIVQAETGETAVLEKL